MNIKNNSFSRFTLLILLSLLVACGLDNPSPIATQTTEFHIGDGGFISKTPCGPPCFWDSTPGITTKADLLKQLALHGVDTDKCKYSQRTNPDQSEIVCGPVNLGYTIGISIDTSGIVKDIGFMPETNFSMEKVIATYGDPDAVSVVDQNVTAMPPDFAIRLYYDKLQAVLSLSDQETSVQIIADLEIKDVLYSNVQSYGESRKYTQPWHGYGEYLANP
jgi:hypothetical protein